MKYFFDCCIVLVGRSLRYSTHSSRNFNVESVKFSELFAAPVSALRSCFVRKSGGYEMILGAVQPVLTFGGNCINPFFTRYVSWPSVYPCALSRASLSLTLSHPPHRPFQIFEHGYTTPVRDHLRRTPSPPLPDGLGIGRR